MEKLRSIKQLPNETVDMLWQRVSISADLNLAEAFTRKKRESAVDQVRRFVEWYDPINNNKDHPDNNIDDTFFNEPRVGDTGADFQNRKSDFYGKRNELFVEADKELFNLIQQRPKETLQMWIDRVKAIILNNSDIIENQWIGETDQEFHERRERFYSQREMIVGKIAVESFKSDRKKVLETEEKAKFDIRRAEKKKEEKEEEKIAKKREEAEKEAEKAEKLQLEQKKALAKKRYEDHIKYKIFILLVLLCSICFSIYTYSVITVIIFSLVILSLQFVRVKKEVLEYKPIYCLLSAIYFVYIKLK